MSLLFGASREDRGLIVRTLRALGPTSVPGLAAALSWSPRKTERLVRDLVRHGAGGLFYDPGSGLVRIGPPPVVGTAPAPSQAEAAPLDPIPSTPIPRLPNAPRGVRTPTGAATPTPSVAPQRGACPSCAGTMEPTADAQALVCRTCGRMTLRPRASAGRPTEPAASTASPPVVASHGPVPDRKAQEMFAAYATARPIPCPRCRSPLRHRGLAEYACPACGESVRFPSNTSMGPSSSAPPLPAAAPRTAPELSATPR